MNQRAAHDLDLHICVVCGSGLVYPTTWEPAAAQRWSIALRCPECEWSGRGVYAQAAVERFDEVLDRGTEQVLTDLRAMVRANIEEEVARFAAALEAGHIIPEDF